LERFFEGLSKKNILKIFFKRFKGKKWSQRDPPGETPRPKKTESSTKELETKEQRRADGGM
jgi:hypothetical protein